MEIVPMNYALRWSTGLDLLMEYGRHPLTYTMVLFLISISFYLHGKSGQKPFTWAIWNLTPQNVGLEYGKLSGGFKLDTSIKGNSNRGHEFDYGSKGNGIIGRYLSPDERMALIEFLKTL